MNDGVWFFSTRWHQLARPSKPFFHLGGDRLRPADSGEDGTHTGGRGAFQLAEQPAKKRWRLRAHPGTSLSLIQMFVFFPRASYLTGAWCYTGVHSDAVRTNLPLMKSSDLSAASKRFAPT